MDAIGPSGGYWHKQFGVFLQRVESTVESEHMHWICSLSMRDKLRGSMHVKHKRFAHESIVHGHEWFMIKTHQASQTSYAQWKIQQRLHPTKTTHVASCIAHAHTSQKRTLNLWERKGNEFIANIFIIYSYFSCKVEYDIDKFIHSPKYKYHEVTWLLV